MKPRRIHKYLLLILFAAVYGLPNPVNGEEHPRHMPNVSGSSSDISSGSPIRFTHPLNLNLSVNTAFIQDRQGFLWVGTQNGLVKYNGYETKIYRTGPNSISNDNVVSLLEDSQGALWIGTQGGGVDRYDKETNRFIAYRHDPKNDKSIGSDIVAIGPQALFIDKTGVLWVGTQTSGLDRFDPKTGVFTHYRHDPNNAQSISDNTVWSVIEDPSGRLWVGTAGGLDEMDRKTGHFKHYIYNPAYPDGIGKGWVYRILVDNRDPEVLWLGSVGSGLIRFETKKQVFKRFKHDLQTSDHTGDEILGLYQDDNDRLWIGWFRVPAAGGLSIFNKKTGKFTDYLPNPDNPAGVSGNQIRSILEDASGIVWLMNYNGIMDSYDRVGHPFRLYQHDPHNSKSISDSSGVPFYQDRAGVIWIGTGSGGLNRYNPADESFTCYRFDPRDPLSIRNNFVTRIFEDKTGTFWVATRGGALSIFDRKTGRCVRHFQHDPANPDSIPDNESVRYILEDKDDPNILWMGAYLGGFFKFDKQTGKFTNYPVSHTDSNALNNNSVMHLYQDSSGYIWLSTMGGGINRFDKKSGAFVHFVHEPKNPSSLGANQIWETQEYTPGYLWIATVGGGLELYDIRRGTFKRYTKENGFPANTVLTIRRDNSGNLWMGTDEGLVRFNPETGKTRVYKKNDGLQGDVFLDAAALSAQNGEMWFGGVNGVNRFDPEQVRDNPYIPPVVLTTFKQGGEEIHFDKDLTRLRQIKLDWRQNFFEFEYAALGYTRPEKNQYAYKLEGFDKDWFYAGTRRFGRYSGLPPGNYTLRIRGSNNDGVWNNQGVTLGITIVPPYWDTWWFKALVLFVLASCGLGAFILRLRSLQHQKRQLEMRVEERTQELKFAKETAENARRAAEAANQAKTVFLANMSHELRTPLNSIMGYAQILKRDGLDPFFVKGLDIIRHSSHHLLTLINDILDLSKVEANKMELFPAEIQLPAFLEIIAGIIQNRAVSKKLEFKLETSGSLPLFIVADEVRLRQVLLNLLGNAVKFTYTGRVLFKVSRLNRPGADHGGQTNQAVLRFEVIDTGIGLTEDQIGQLFQPFQQVGGPLFKAEGTGLGLAISRQLVRLMGSDIHVESIPEQGSRFWFNIAVPAGESGPTKEPERKVTGYRGPRRKILVVDDLPTNRNVLLDFLKPLGFVIMEAENGEQAVESIFRERPDLVLMDRWMPGMDGLEAVQRIRRVSDLKQLPIIAVSASVSERDMEKSLTMGFVDFIMKPVEWTKLLVVLEKQLQLTWENESDPTEERIDETQMIPPPPEVLKNLFDLAKIGDIRAIQEQIPYLQSLGEPYHPFAVKLAKLAEGFKEKEILSLIKHYLNG